MNKQRAFVENCMENVMQLWTRERYLIILVIIRLLFLAAILIEWKIINILVCTNFKSHMEVSVEMTKINQKTEIVDNCSFTSNLKVKILHVVPLYTEKQSHLVSLVKLFGMCPLTKDHGIIFCF